jgi:quercetin dioxygenase-like cupin family protein
MTVIRKAERRRTETPNAVMTTFASPTQGGAERSLWQVEMATGSSGPVHVFDVEQTWTILEGSATVDVDGASFALDTGDTIVIPPDVERRFASGAEGGYRAVVTASATALATVPGSDADAVNPPWIA